MGIVPKTVVFDSHKRGQSYLIMYKAQGLGVPIQIGGIFVTPSIPRMMPDKTL